MPAATTNPPQQPAQPRLLSGAGGRSGTITATEATSFAATIPFNRPQPTTTRAAAAPTPVSGALPRWAKGVVIGGVLLAVAMPASVLMSRSMLVQEALTEQSSSKAAMVCTGGEGKAVDDSSLLGWLFGGSYFSCGDWETREARVQRDRDRDQANYMARERAKQGLN
ncbi:hypothetical protein [Roseateles sp. P5_E11]